MKTLVHWRVKLKKVLKENDGCFGFNINVPITKFLNKLEKLGSIDGRVDARPLCQIEILNEYSVRVSLPADYKDGAKFRENILLHILTETTSSVFYNKKKDQITIEWNF